MNSWTGRIIIIVLAALFVPFLAGIISQIVVQGVQALTNWTANLFRGNMGLGGMVKLCVYLIAITLLIKIITKK